MMNATLDPRLQKLIDLGESGTDILHGELKNLMLDTEQLLDGDNDDRFLEGRLDALVEVYALTYQLAFAISDRAKANG
jgi:hypothetical protein